MNRNFRRWLLFLGVVAALMIPRSGTGESNDDLDKIPDLDEIIAEESQDKPTLSEASSPSDADAVDAASLDPISPDVAPPTGAPAGTNETLTSESAPGSDLAEVKPGTQPAEEESVELPEDAPPPDASTLGEAPPAETPGNGRGVAEFDAPPSNDVQKLEPVGAPPSLPSSVSGTSQFRNQVTNLEFKMENGKSRIIVSAARPLNYQEQGNPQAKQFTYLFENTEIPQRLQRAYDTSEFISPVALFTMLQMPGSNPPLTKLIVQLREPKPAEIVPSANGLVIQFPSPDSKSEPRIVLEGGGTGTGTAQIEGNTYTSNQSFTGKPIGHFEIKNTDVQDVLRFLAKWSDYNIVVGDDVTGKVGSLRLDNVPWDQAFNLILQTKRLGYIKSGNVIRVATLQTLKAEKEEAAANENARLKMEPLKTVLIPINYAKASELSTRGKTLLTERGALEVDTRTNTIIVKDVESVVGRIQKLFAALDSPPSKVSISARIIEMSNQFQQNLGFASTIANPSVGGVNLSYTSKLDITSHSLVTIDAPAFAGLLADFTLAEIDGKVRSLANPSVTVMANQQATVNQSVSVVIVTNDAVAGGQVIPGVRQVTANLTLDVTPIVSNDGSIFMDLNIRNEIPNFKDVKNLSIDSRNIKTQVLVESGDTAVIGGIFQNTVSSSQLGIPFLMRIPILGFFFSGNKFSDDKNEVFVFLTAKIMNAETSFRRNAS